MPLKEIYYKDQELLTRALADSVWSTEGKEFDDENSWQIDGIAMGSRLILQVLSFQNLSKGSHFIFKDGLTIEPQIDEASILAIVRSIIDTYLTFYYIYVDPETIDEIKFRKKLWETSILSFAQNASPFHENKESFQEFVRKELENKVNELERSEHFEKNTSNKSKAKIKKRQGFDWKPDGGWAEIANRSPLTKRVYIETYSWLSSFVHSDTLSLSPFTIRDYDQLFADSVDSSILTVNLLMCLFVDGFTKIFDEANEWYADKEKLKKTINEYKKINEQLSLHNL